MEQKKEKKPKLVTPVYPAQWCWLLTPDTRWSELGVYGCELIMSAEHAREMCLAAKPDIDAQAKKIRDEDSSMRDWPLAWPVKDDPENPSLKLVAFQQKVVANFNFTVDVFDAKNNQIDPASGLRIGNGTKLRLSYYVRVVGDNLNKCLRIKFHPRAAQIIELVPWKADYGFDEQDGFVANGQGKNPRPTPRSTGFDPDNEFAGASVKPGVGDPDGTGGDDIPF